MKSYLIIIVVLLNFGVVSAQNRFPTNPEPIENISKEITKISKSLESLNEKLKNFTETFSSNQGLRLSERQQRLLAAFEYLNRAEQRLATLQILKINLTEKQSSVKVKIAEIDDGLRPESVDRSVALRGTTNAEELRSNRRQLLSREKSELTMLLGEIQNTINETNFEIRQTENFLKNIRQRIFPEIEKDLSEL
jgi:hypothetical protein